MTAPDGAAFVRFSLKKAGLTPKEVQAQVYEYIGEVWEYDTYKNLYFIVVTDAGYSKAIADMIEGKFVDGSLAPADLFADESILYKQMKGWDEFHWNLVDADKEKYSSSVNYTQVTGYTPAAKDEDARNYLDGVYGSKTTAIKYPTFQGGKYSMNYINHNDAFNISKAIAGDSNNVYGLKSNSTDSHLIKNSEWGAVAYLGQSQYGLYNKNIRINNVNMGDNSHFVYAFYFSQYQKLL